MTRNYNKIIAWERAHELTLRVYRVTRMFPKEETFGLTGQLRRAAYGVRLNIAEGSGRDSKKDYLRLLYIANASLRETEYFLDATSFRGALLRIFLSQRDRSDGSFIWQTLIQEDEIQIDLIPNRWTSIDHFANFRT